MIVLLMTMVFAVVRLAPGDPLEAGVVETVESRDRELLRQRLGLDEPLADQYLRWVAGSLRGDWGPACVSSGRWSISSARRRGPRCCCR